MGFVAPAALLVALGLLGAVLATYLLRPRRPVRRISSTFLWLAALNDLQGVNVRNLQVDSSGEATEITVGLKTGVGVPLERMLGDLAGRDDVAAMSYDER